MVRIINVWKKALVCLHYLKIEIILIDSPHHICCGICQFQYKKILSCNPNNGIMTKK